MKRFIKSLTLVALFASYFIPSWAQASTEGKEFWATLTIGDNNEKKKEFKPYIAISSKKACKVIITNPRTGYRKEKDVLANDWTTIKDIPLTEWYPSTDTDNSHDPNYSENPYDNGLLIQSDEDISVYVANRMKYSFDASNILPVTALGSEYITQDFPPSEQRSVFAILATEDDTKIDITPTAQTVKGKTGTFQITLQRGETYQVMSNSETESLSGSHIFAHDGKKIAVFLGCVRTRIPADKAARDLLYEQAFPLDLWGTTFVVSRSKDRNADRVRITAAYNDTEVSIDGVSVTERPLKAGETFEFEMSDSTVYASSGSRTKAPAYVCKNEAAFIETTCPCAVFLYATGQDYDKPTSGLGDPYMVWISPLEQMASEITFGACPTEQTQIHYANIITKKEDVNSLQLLAHEENFKNIISPNDFTPVPGNSDYCYALIKLGTAADEDSKLTFTLKGGRFVAHIYGHGEQESYAYSAGSSTLKNSMQIDGFALDADRTKNKTFCVNKVLEFTPYAEGNFVVTQMRIDFGDGVILDTIVPDPQSQITNISVLHKYTSPSWYDITANYGGYKKCPQGAYIDLGTVKFSFYVSRPDTIRHVRDTCVAEDYTGDLTILDTIPYGCDSVVVGMFFIHRKSSATIPVSVEDAWTFKDSTYTTSTEIYDTIPNFVGCDSAITYQLNIVKCLGMQFENKPEEQEVCAGANLEIPFSYNRDGGHRDAYLCLVKHDPTAEWGYRLIDTTQIDITEKEGEEGDRKLAVVTLPIKSWAPGHYVGCVLIEDANCKRTEGGIEVPNIEQSTALDITVKYPEELLVFKFNNVLAVLQNKGYEFVTYQWYLNGEKIDPLKNPSAATSVFHTEEIFTPGDEYFVMLTEKGKDALASCSFFVPKQEDLDDYTTKKDAPAATKKLINNRMCVEFDGRTYDMYGQRIK